MENLCSTDWGAPLIFQQQSSVCVCVCVVSTGQTTDSVRTCAYGTHNMGNTALKGCTTLAIKQKLNKLLFTSVHCARGFVTCGGQGARCGTGSRAVQAAGSDSDDTNTHTHNTPQLHSAHNEANRWHACACGAPKNARTVNASACSLSLPTHVVVCVTTPHPRPTNTT